MSIKVISLASGSKGNCTYISDGTTNLLVDDGISYRRLCECFRQADLDIGNLSCVLVTHEHSDHVGGLSQLIKMQGVKVICPKKVQNVLLQYNIPIDDNTIYSDSGFEIGSFAVQPFRIMHDTVYPVGYSLVSGGKKVSVVTDMGKVTPSVIENVSGSAIAVLESNHDINMLKSGPYPQYLKQRILGNNGHLSNDAAAELACTLCNTGAKKLLLAHLSEENNLPELAYKTNCNALCRMGAELEHDISVQVTKQYGITYSEV